MNNDKDLFCQALQRQNERAARMKMPDDMEQWVMKHIETEEKKPTRNVFLFALRAIASTAAVILIGLFLHVYEPVKKTSNDHSYDKTNWTGGSTLKNVYTSNLQPKQATFSYIQLKKKLYEKY